MCYCVHVKLFLSVALLDNEYSVERNVVIEMVQYAVWAASIVIVGIRECRHRLIRVIAGFSILLYGIWRCRVKTTLSGVLLLELPVFSFCAS